MLLRRGIQDATRRLRPSCGAARGDSGDLSPAARRTYVSAGASGSRASAACMSESENSGSSRLPARYAS
jgi:hypothetical protein